MDGALRPNTALDDGAAELLEATAPDNLAAAGGARILLQRQRSVATAGVRRRRAGGGRAASMRRSARWPVRPTAPSPSRSTTARILLNGGTLDGKTLAGGFGGLACPTALAFADAGTLLVVPGLGRPSPVRLGRRPHGQECERLGLARRSRPPDAPASSPAISPFPTALLADRGGRRRSSWPRAGGTGWCASRRERRRGRAGARRSCRAIRRGWRPARTAAPGSACSRRATGSSSSCSRRTHYRADMMRRGRARALDRAGAVVGRAASSSRCNAAA